MGFRPNCFLYLYSTLILVLHFTCTAHLYILYKALMYILSLKNTLQSSSISNMVSELLLWSFLSSLVFISVTPFSFSTSLLPLQPLPQPFAVEPPTSTSRRPWVPDLQPPLLRSFTLHRPLPLASPLQTLLRLRFWSYHRDCLASIYKTVKNSTSSETACAPTRRLKFLYGWSRAPRAARTLHAPPHAYTRLFSPADVSPSDVICHVNCWHHLLTSSVTHLLTSSFDQTVDLRWLWPLTFSVQVLLA